MATLSLRIDNEELELLKEYASINNTNVSSLVRNLILDKLYDDIGVDEEERILKKWKKAKAEGGSDALEVFERLGI